MNRTITLQVEPAAARALKGAGSDVSSCGELRAAIDQLGSSLREMHPGTDDPTLETFFSLDLPASGAAEPILERIRSCKAVVAAYVKPLDELP